MRKAIRSIHVSLLALCMAVAFPASADDLRLSAVLRDAVTATPISGASMECSHGTQSSSFLPGQDGRYEMNKLPISKGGPIEIRIQPGGQYIGRTATLRLLGRESRRSLRFFTVKQAPQYTYPYLDAGLKFHEAGEFDRALAYYEAAYRASLPLPKKLTQFDVKLKFNYARSLVNACLRMGYETCENAKKLYRELKADSQEFPKLFQGEGIAIAELDATLKDLGTSEVIQKYGAFTEAFNAKDYLTAAKQGQELIAGYEDQSTAFANARITQDRLKADVGTAYYRAASLQTGEGAADVKSLLESSQKLLSEIEQKSPATYRDIATVKARIGQVE